MMIWSLSAVLTALTVSVVANDGLISIPFVAVDRKAAHVPAWKFQKLGSAVNVPLENIDLAYLMELSIGTPPQPFTLLLDTGSSTTWVPESGCGRLCGYPPHTLSPKNSSTYEQSNLPFSIRYGEGFSRGVYARDTVTLNDNVVIPNTYFALSNFNDGELSRDGADGILGIGPDVLSRYNNPNDEIVPTLVSSMYNAGVIGDSSFSIYFKSLDGNMDDNRVNGDIIFGGVDLSKVEGGKIDYMPITKSIQFQDYWAVDINSIKVGERSIPYRPHVTALVDTGSTLIFLPQEVIVEAFNNVTGLSVDYLGQYLVPCDGKGLKPITFNIGGSAFTLQPEEYLVPPIVGGTIYQQRQYCYTYLHESPGFVDAILGYGFLQKFVSVYDDKNRRIGFGRVKSDESS